MDSTHPEIPEILLPVEVLNEGEEKVASHRVEFIGATCQLLPGKALPNTHIHALKGLRPHIPFAGQSCIGQNLCRLPNLVLHGPKLRVLGLRLLQPESCFGPGTGTPDPVHVTFSMDSPHGRLSWVLWDAEQPLGLCPIPTAKQSPDTS